MRTSGRAQIFKAASIVETTFDEEVTEQIEGSEQLTTETEEFSENVENR